MPIGNERIPTRLEASYQEVLASLREVVAEAGGTGKLNTPLLLWGAARRLGYESTYHPGDKFAGQVRRAADQLVREGVMTHVKSGEYGPGGSRTTEARWYTPEGYQRDDERLKREQAAAQDQARRWQQVRDALDAAGFTPESGLGPELRLPLWDWERLVSLLPVPGGSRPGAG